MSDQNMWQIEQACMQGGYKTICGVDEAVEAPWPVPFALLL